MNPILFQVILGEDDFSVGENCVIEKAILDEHTCIGNNVQLINKDKLKKV